MASLSVRKIDDNTFSRLRVRAAEHGISMEEEVRQILKRSVAVPEQLGDLAIRFFGPMHGVELKLSKHKPHEPMSFSL